MNILLEIPLFRDILIPAVDILVLAFILYRGYLILVQTRAVQLLKGAVFLALVYGFAFLLNLRTLLWVMNFLAPSLVIGIAIIFQPELRKVFTRIGQGGVFRFGRQPQALQLNEVLNAARSLSEVRRGALIVFGRQINLKSIADTGTRLNADLSSALLVSIFGHDTPLHDGAVIIDRGRVVTAGAFLPLSEQLDIRRSFGTRHRAALGLAEESDAVVLVVSEESGAISLAYDANLYYDLGYDAARGRLRSLLGLDADDAEEVEEVPVFED